jgi:hypothetical protein
MARSEERRQDLQRLYARITAQAWRDEDFKKRLMSDPAAVLKEYGVNLPSGRQVRVVENTDHVFNLVLKQKPHDLTHEELDKGAAAGSCVVTECDICATY